MINKSTIDSLVSCKVIALLLSFLLFGAVKAQYPLDSCSKQLSREIDLFIPGSVDTIQSSGKKVKAIHAGLLSQDFYLASGDSSVKVLGFRLTFEDRDGNYYVLIAKKGKMLVNNWAFNPNRIHSASLVELIDISIEMDGKCYHVPDQIYLIRK